eukprot:2345279-Karenia_brevis.AAC.1
MAPRCCRICETPRLEAVQHPGCEYHHGPLGVQGVIIVMGNGYLLLEGAGSHSTLCKGPCPPGQNLYPN